MGSRSAASQTIIAHVLIPGYGATALVDGTSLLSRRPLWPVHLNPTTRDDDRLHAGFGIDAGEAERFFEELSDPEGWPTFRIPLPAGHTIWVVYRNFDEDSGIDFLLGHSAWPKALPLAAIEGCFSGPGLSWWELAAVAEARDGDDEVEAASRRLLLLLPILGDADLPADATPRVASALTACGAVGDGTELASLLLSNHRLWPPSRWWQDERGTWVCDGPWSARNPASTVMAPAERSMVSQALGRG